MAASDDLRARKETLAKLQAQSAEQNKQLDAQLRLLESTKANAKGYNKMVEEARELAKLTAKVDAEMNETAKSIAKVEGRIAKANERLENFSSRVQDLVTKVPLVGDGFAAGIQKATDVAKELMNKWLTETDSDVRKRFKIMGAVIGGLLLGGLIATWKVFSNMLGKAKDTFFEVSAAMTETARSLQLSKDQVLAIGKGVGDWAHYGAGWASAIQGIRDNMGMIPQLTKEENKLVAQLATNAGMSAEHITTMYRFSLQTNQSLTEYTKSQSKRINLLNKEMGLQFTQAEIISEMASATDETLAMFSKQNGELEKQVLIGKKIGLNLNDQAKIARSLLDIESSIEAEMEARALTGKNINFDKARELALNNDISGAAEEVMKQVGGMEQWQNMSMIEKEAMAKAAGMDMGAMNKALEKQAGLGNQAALGGAGLATTNMSAAEVEAQRDRRWGELLSDGFKAIKDLKYAIGDKLYNWLSNSGIMDKISAGLTSLSDWIIKGEEPKWFTNLKTYISPLIDWFKDYSGLFAAGIGMLAGRKLFTGVKNLIFGKRDGSSPNNALFVKIAGMGGGLGNMMGGRKGGGGGGGSVPGGAGGGKAGGGGFFSRMKGKVSGAGKKFMGVARSLNPLNALKKSFTGGAGKFMKKALGFGGKFAKGGLLGAILNAGNLLNILTNENMTSLEKASGIIQAGAGIIGGGIGSIAGSIVPVIGTFGGGMLGHMIGDWIGTMPGVQKALAPPLAKALEGDDVAEDFILSGRGIQKFRKDDLVVGGTALNKALGRDDNKTLDEIAGLLKELIQVSSKNLTLSVDGVQLAQGLDRARNDRTYRGGA